MTQLIIAFIISVLIDQSDNGRALTLVAALAFAFQRNIDAGSEHIQRRQAFASDRFSGFAPVLRRQPFAALFARKRTAVEFNPFHFSGITIVMAFGRRGFAIER